jgi:hypothetical protein
MKDEKGGLLHGTGSEWKEKRFAFQFIFPIQKFALCLNKRKNWGQREKYA